MNNKKVNILAQKTEGISILDSILKSRNITDKEKFFHPERLPLSDPFMFSDMEKAVSIIKNAIQNNEKILIWGDFDADGVTSTSILCKAFDALEANYSYFLPDRINLGHGINLKELLLQKSKNNIKVLITVDCGISNRKEIELIKSMGVKTIITDHHEPPDILPEADCILNPLAKNALKNTLSVAEIENISCMSGAGVAMKLAYALLGENFEKVKKEILALSAIGTISDVVPLIGENRVIAARGLVEINNGVHTGVSRLFELQNFNRKITSEDIAFTLSPRINAAGRLDNPNTSIKLLIENNKLVIDMTIQKLDMLNKVRQNLCEQVYLEALDMIKKRGDCIVLYNEGWHLGIIGIVASRLVERFNVPAFLIAKDDRGIYRASIRGTASYDIAKILKSLKENFIGSGGHAFAGGFSADPETITIEELTNKITEVVQNSKDEMKNDDTIDVVMELSGKDLTMGLVKDIEKLQPFGAENKRPNFLFRDAKLISQRQIGKEYNHLAFNVVKDNIEFNCVYWKKKIIGIKDDERIDFIFKPELNIFNGEASLQLSAECVLNDVIEERFNDGVKIFDHRQKTGILPKIDEYLKYKEGQVKVFAPTVGTRKMIEKFPSIKENLVTDFSRKEESLMLFDFPPCLENLREIIEGLRPRTVHLMNAVYSKNPDDYITLICGMLKFAANKKDGYIDTETLTEAAGLDMNCVLMILEILEKSGCILMEEIDKVNFIGPVSLDVVRNLSCYADFKAEFKQVIDFKEYLKTADIDSIRRLCSV